MIFVITDINVTPLNALYQPIIRNKRPSIIISKRGRESKRLLGYAMASLAPKKPFEGKVSVKIDMLCKNKKAPDIDALLKLLLDSMEKLIYTNDRNVEELHIRKFLDQKEDKLIIEVKEI